MSNGILIPIELLERLAPEQPMNDDEQGGCIWCGWSESMLYFTKGSKKIGSIYADSRFETHTPDCPWIAARKLLGKKK